MIVETKGAWQKFKDMVQQEFEAERNYTIKFQGDCLLSFSVAKPTYGFSTNKITCTKDEIENLWIKTGN